MKRILVMIDSGRARVHTTLIKVSPQMDVIMWQPDDDHPLGGRYVTVTLIKRVNLRKDRLPRWMTTRPLFEYVRN